MLRESAFNLISPKGHYRDVLVDSQGSTVWEHPWQSNLIVDGLRQLLAALVKGDSQGQPLMFWALGSGEPTWDEDNANIPSPEERQERDRLFNEVARKAIQPGQISFFPLGSTLSNQLQIRVLFSVDEVIFGGIEEQTLREFGLFAAGSEAVDSGILINHVIHPQFDLRRGFTLDRTLRLTF